MALGMDSGLANRLSEYARDHLGLQAEALDPRRFYVMYADRGTIASVRDKISSDESLEAVTESIDEWLKTADPVE